MKKHWQMLQPDISSVRKISKALKCNPIIASILVNRNIVSVEDAFDFLNPSFNNMRSPFSIKSHDNSRFITYPDDKGLLNMFKLACGIDILTNFKRIIDPYRFNGFIGSFTGIR